VLFEPVRKTQDAMFFFKSPEGMWIPCGPKQHGAVQTTMQDLATKGLASKVFNVYSRTVPSVFIFLMIIGEVELSLDELVIYLIEAGKCLLL